MPPQIDFDWAYFLDDEVLSANHGPATRPTTPPCTPPDFRAQSILPPGEILSIGRRHNSPQFELPDLRSWDTSNRSIPSSALFPRPIRHIASAPPISQMGRQTEESRALLYPRHSAVPQSTRPFQTSVVVPHAQQKQNHISRAVPYAAGAATSPSSMINFTSEFRAAEPRPQPGDSSTPFFGAGSRMAAMASGRAINASIPSLTSK